MILYALLDGFYLFFFVLLFITLGIVQMLKSLFVCDTFVLCMGKSATLSLPSGAIILEYTKLNLWNFK